MRTGAQEVREKLLDFQLGRIAPEDFVEWVTLASWDLPAGTDTEVTRLLGKTELYLAEYTSGHRGLMELRASVGSLAVTKDGR